MIPVQKPANQFFEISRAELLQFLRMAKPSVDRLLGSVVFGVKDQRLVANFTSRRANITQRMGAYGYKEQFPIMVHFKEVWKMVQSSKAERLALHCIGMIPVSIWTPKIPGLLATLRLSAS